jgi:AcrR family transcriptional regulator
MAARNQEAVFDAAASLFASRGWAATGMRDIARAAGVSVETVYGAAGSKSDLLLKVIDIGIVGDNEAVPLSERPEFVALGHGNRSERVQAAAELITASNARIAALNRTFAHAAAGDAQLAARWHESQLTQRAAYAEALRLVTGRRPRADVVDIVWTLGNHEVYLQLVELAGWRPQKYRTWLVEHIDRLTTPQPEEKS